MVLPDFKKPSNIINFIEFICSAVVVGLNFGLKCEFTKATHFIDGTTIGYLVISLAVVFGLFLDEALGDRLCLIISFLGLGIYIGAGVLLIEAGNEGYCEGRIATIISGAVSLLAAISYLIEFILKIYS